MSKYRITDGLTWGREFDASCLSEYQEQIIEGILEYNLSLTSPYKKQRHQELIKKYIENVSRGIPLTRFHESYIGMMNKVSPTPLSLHVQLNYHGHWLVNSKTHFAVTPENIEASYNNMQETESWANQIDQFCIDVMRMIDEAEKGDTE